MSDLQPSLYIDLSTQKNGYQGFYIQDITHVYIFCRLSFKIRYYERKFPKLKDLALLCLFLIFRLLFSTSNLFLNWSVSISKVSCMLENFQSRGSFKLVLGNKTVKQVDVLTTLP